MNKDQSEDELVRDACSIVPVPKGLYRQRLLAWRDHYIKICVLEGRIEELSQIVAPKDTLNDIYGDDPRNNYGYQEDQVRDAARYLRSKHQKRIDDLQSQLLELRKEK